LKIILVTSAEEKNVGQPSKNYRTFYSKKLSVSSHKYGFGIRDPEKNLFRIPDPGVKKAPDPGTGSAKQQNIIILLLGNIVGFLSQPIHQK
jgi:hypothetical protein